LWFRAAHAIAVPALASPAAKDIALQHVAVIFCQVAAMSTD
jgi:hypothetical protein